MSLLRVSCAKCEYVHPKSFLSVLEHNFRFFFFYGLRQNKITIPRETSMKTYFIFLIRWLS